jgi:hypothetical protein
MKELNKFYEYWNGDVEIGQNPLLWATFCGFFRFLEEK